MNERRSLFLQCVGGAGKRFDQGGILLIRFVHQGDGLVDDLDAPALLHERLVEVAHDLRDAAHVADDFADRRSGLIRQTAAGSHV